MKLSEKIKCVSPSKTLAITQRAKEMKNAGIDVISFGVGEPDFNTPEPICAAAKTAIDEGFTRYTPVPGLPELRKAISEDIARKTGVKYDPNQIISTCGAKAALYLVFQILTNPGDEVLIPAPYWVSYPEQVKLAGAKPVTVKTSESGNFKITPVVIEKNVTDRTRLLILNSPSNPTGAVYTSAELKRIYECCIPKGITIIADEIYDKLCFDDDFSSCITSHPKAVKHTIYINGVSKSHAMTGWRMGYAAGPNEVIAAMIKYQGQLYTNITAFVQKAAITALNISPEIIVEMKNTFMARRNIALENIKGIPGMTCTKPGGTFYLFPSVKEFFGKKSGSTTINSSEELASLLLEEAHVAVVPGTAFGLEGYIRLSFALSEEEIKKGLEKIRDFLVTLK